MTVQRMGVSSGMRRKQILLALEPQFGITDAVAIGQKWIDSTFWPVQQIPRSCIDRERDKDVSWRAVTPCETKINHAAAERRGKPESRPTLGELNDPLQFTFPIILCSAAPSLWIRGRPVSLRRSEAADCCRRAPLTDDYCDDQEGNDVED